MEPNQEIPSSQSIHYFIYTFGANQRFNSAAKAMLRQVREIQRKIPNAKRGLFLLIEGHRNADGGFDTDAFDLQVNFVINFLMNYLAHAIMPLGSIRNDHQRNDIPQSDQWPGVAVKGPWGDGPRSFRPIRCTARDQAWRGVLFSIVRSPPT